MNLDRVFEKVIPQSLLQSRASARREAYKLAFRRSQHIAGATQENLPPSEHVKDAAEAVRGAREGFWKPMKTFLNTEAVGASIFGNVKAVKRLERLKNRV